ncbi:hypothetical protein GCM10014715_69280 [Streptomyces spiralis]|uniref:Gram-positive cocci surface proteins LPxTG domain-containing protein n=1 Tax=Streptomyces spiralis TaxID=66376 RepID=A0A919AEV9_9ACTN|nr:hypothetical protein [Streptomyces spiralis]GHF03183.1 hypothetical protein GCM10014715_69280 [Streptomyces spiralis]
MRLCTSLSPCLAAAALLLAGPTLARADSRPACAGPDDRHFPITSRIHGGPAAYRAGGGYGTFSLDLTNTTSGTCAAVHPVVVLVDGKRALKAGQTRLEFYDGARVHPVRLESTDQDELVGPFDAGLPGFTVGPGRTVTVKVRLSFTSDAVANEVTANAAVVQRHDDDGDWVGQSNDYRFRIRSHAHTDTGPAPSATSTTTPTASADPADPDDDLPFADQLARTGLVTPHGVITAVALLLAAGGTLVLTWRRR